MTVYDLLDIPCVEREWQTFYKIKALSVNGRCDVIEKLEDWKLSSQQEHKTIVSGIRLVVGRKNRHPKRTGSCRGYSPLFEIKNPGGGKARLFCFLHKNKVIVVCGTHWKDPKRQDTDMETAYNLMIGFINSGIGDNNG